MVKWFNASPRLRVVLTRFSCFGFVKLQCALNMEEYDIAQQLRNKLTEVRFLILFM